ncbi:hypothetical protein DID88_008589 [Monilinia fructigena]|uniref:Uncharacterized protein n=1 Tax=Monilinia fructigena TaxID=38457 RepID=A0A395J886_9HELO|nr:hypothetical protein DID88_008589 [Monilinia fructigena]
MGGSSSRNWKAQVRSIINYLAVFTFVALWHDISLNLLVWGWLIVFFMLPEVIAGMLFPRKKWLNDLTYYRVICGIGAVANLMFMMIANLVGFAVGIDGLKSIISGIFKDFSGIVFLITAWGALFVGCQVMFELWRSGGVEEWRSGGVEEWRSGGVEEWRSGGVEEWRSGGVEEWRSGGVEEWRSGGVEEWRSGGVEEWRSGGVEE